MPAPCCSARPGPSGRNWSATSPAAARGSPARSASSRASCWRKSSAGCATSRRFVEVTRARGAGAAGRADRRRRRPHHAAGASPARRRRRPLHLGVGMDFAVDPATGMTNVGMRRLMLRGRDETGIDLVSPSDLRAIYEASAARRQAAAGERSWSARTRSIISPPRCGCRCDELALLVVAARRAAAGGQVRHQRPARAGRRRMGARGLSRRARPRGAGRAVRRVPRLLRRA